MPKPKLFLFSLIIFNCLITPLNISAQLIEPSGGTPIAPSGGTPIAPNEDNTLNIKAAFTELICSVGLWGKCKDGTPPAPVEPRVLILRVAQTILGFVSLLALIIIIYAGVLWITSAGVPDKIKKARGLLIWAFIGLAVLMSAWTLISYVIYVSSKIAG